MYVCVKAYDLEEEKSLPGVLMATEGRVFSILYQLARTEDPAVLAAIRQELLPLTHHLLPTYSPLTPHLLLTYSSLTPQLLTTTSTLSHHYLTNYSPITHHFLTTTSPHTCHVLTIY